MYSPKELKVKTQLGCPSVCREAMLHTDAFLCNKQTLKLPHQSRSNLLKSQMSVCKPCGHSVDGGSSVCVS